MKVSYRSAKRTVIDYFVYVDGERFNFFDTLATLRAINDCCSTVVITDKEMIKVFKENDIIEYEGSRQSSMGARFAPNGKKFLSMLVEKEEKIYKKVKK